MNSLIIRGENNENAVVCTNNSTFSFKVAEISNPLLVATNLKFPSKDDLNKENETRCVHSVEVNRFILKFY